MANIDDLPDELLVKVFSLLKVDELWSGVGRVCRRWSQLARDPSAWSRRIAAGPGTRTTTTCTLLEWLAIAGRRLRGVELFARNDANAVLAKVPVIFK